MHSWDADLSDKYYLAWLNPFDYAQTTTYQQAQGQIAIGSGGIFGQGFNASNLLYSSPRE